MKLLFFEEIHPQEDSSPKGFIPKSFHPRKAVAMKITFFKVAAVMMVFTLVACYNPNPGVGNVRGVTSLGDGRVAVTRGRGLFGGHPPPFVIDCNRQDSPFC